MTVTNNEIAREFAERLLAIEAVSLSPDAPFTWASGLHSPIYCDNRVTLSDPQTRDLIADGLASLVRTNFHQVDVVAGTATAGIAHAALAADRLGAPMAYVRSVPKDHGRGNQIEGRIPAHSKVIMVEDPEPEGPFGAKGGGEIGLVPTAPAVAGALEAFDGVRRYELPMKDSPAARAMKVGRIRSLGQ